MASTIDWVVRLLVPAVDEVFYFTALHLLNGQLAAAVAIQDQSTALTKGLVSVTHPGNQIRRFLKMQYEKLKPTTASKSSAGPVITFSSRSAF